MTYEPDEQDELVEDAMAVGGPAFVDELHYAAMDAAEAVCPWDGNGDEPVEYRRAWIAAARALVADRRSRLSRDGGDGATSELSGERDSHRADDSAAGPMLPGR